MTTVNFDSIKNGLVRWAELQPEIRAVILVGSMARRNRPADIWSDLDLIVYTTEAKKFLQDGGWLTQFGEIWAQAMDHTPRGDPEWYIFYAGGYKVDILFVDIHSLQGDCLVDWVQHPDFAEVLPRGMLVLLDKTSSQGNLPQLFIQPAGIPPTQENLNRLTNQFYLSAVRAGRLLNRRDLWRARQAVDEEMKQALLRMVEWHAISIHGLNYDVWYDGRFIKEWASPEVLARLPSCFGGLEFELLRSAFLNTISLFDDLGNEIAKNMNLHYPVSVSVPVQDWLFKNVV